MEIRLIYKGRLLSTGNDRLKPVDPERDKDIHRIRRDIHRQLAVLWQKHPLLKAKQTLYHAWNKDLSHKANSFQDLTKAREQGIILESLTEVEALGKRFARCGYNFVPLVNDLFNTVCGLDILFLRREDPGQLITTQSGGDIDNRLKTLLDALQIPQGCTQIEGPPSEGETPFYTLLQDDGLVTDLKVTTDRLLTPLELGEKQNDVVLIIHVRIKTSQAWFDVEDEGVEGVDAEVLGARQPQ
jgi:hypothetical protein